MSPQKLAELHDFIAARDLAVVSSLSPQGMPQSAVVAFAVTPDLEIVFDTVSTSRKYRNLKANPRCSLVVWIGEITVQYEGIAEEPAGDRYKEAYFKKLPDGRDRQSWPGNRLFRRAPPNVFATAISMPGRRSLRKFPFSGMAFSRSCRSGFRARYRVANPPA